MEMSTMSREDMQIRWLDQLMEESDCGRLEDLNQPGEFGWIRDGIEDEQVELRKDSAKMTKCASDIGFFRVQGHEVGLTYVEDSALGTFVFNESRAKHIAAHKRMFESHAKVSFAQHESHAKVSFAQDKVDGCGPIADSTVWHRSSVGSVAGLDIFHAVADHPEPGDIAIVNPAAEDRPCGLFLSGGRHGFEETLATQSTLYQSLKKVEEIYQSGDIVYVSESGVKQACDRAGFEWSGGMERVLGKACRVTSIPEPGAVAVVQCDQGYVGLAGETWVFPVGVVTKQEEHARTHTSYMSEDTDARRSYIPADSLVVSPHVEFFRGNQSEGYPFRHSVVKVGHVLSVPMRNTSSGQAVGHTARGNWTQKELEDRFELVLSAAALAGARVLMVPDICAGGSRKYKPADVGRALGTVVKKQFPHTFAEIFVFGAASFVENAEALGTGDPCLPLERALQDSEESIDKLLVKVQEQVAMQKAQLNEARDSVDACKRDLKREQQEVHRMKELLESKEEELRRREEALQRRERATSWLACICTGPPKVANGPAEVIGHDEINIHQDPLATKRLYTLP